MVIVAVVLGLFAVCALGDIFCVEKTYKTLPIKITEEKPFTLPKPEPIPEYPVGTYRIVPSTYQINKFHVEKYMIMYKSATRIGLNGREFYDKPYYDWWKQYNLLEFDSESEASAYIQEKLNEAYLAEQKRIALEEFIAAHPPKIIDKIDMSLAENRE